MAKPHQDEPFFITEEVEAGLLAAGFVFEPPPISCTLRLRDVLGGDERCRAGIAAGRDRWRRAQTPAEQDIFSQLT